MCEHAIFENIIVFSVIINTIILSLDGLVKDSGSLAVMDKMNLSFTIIFAIEMTIKLFAYGFLGYVRDSMNLFDGIIVLISLVITFNLNIL